MESANANVRVVECGGQCPRRVDVCGKKITNFVETVWTKDLRDLENFARCDLPERTEAIMYSVAGMVEDHKRIVSCPNTHLLDGAVLGNEEFDVPSFVCNDMEAAITGMAMLFPKLDYFMGITRSTGIGVRIWKDGKMLSDSEGGHMCIDPSFNAPLCGCGKKGCAEAILAGNAITDFVRKRIREAGRDIPTGRHPCEWLDICYNAHEKWAVAYYENVLIPAFGIFLANIQTLLHLPAIVWKGTLGLRAFRDIPQLEGLIRQEMKTKIINPAWVDDLNFYFLQCQKDHEAYIGAAKIALDLLSE